MSRQELLKTPKAFCVFTKVLTFVVALLLGVSTPFLWRGTNFLFKNRQLVIAGSLCIYLIGASPKCNEAAKKCLITNN